MNTMIRAEYHTTDLWQAAYLDCGGIPFLRVDLRGEKPLFVFDNADDKAFQAGLEFRVEGRAVAPLLPFRQSFRYLAKQADYARTEAIHYDDNTQLD